MLTTLFAVAALARPPATPLPPGNVLVIVLDDVGCDLVGAYDGYFRSIGKPGGTPASTPAIDQLLAARGLMFTNAWTAPMCSPSRARMLTGRYGFRTGIGSVVKEGDLGHVRNPGLQDDVVLLPQLVHLAPTPYTCVAVGKWHLVDAGTALNDLTHPLGNPPGTWFDRYAGSLFNLSRPSGGGVLNVYWDWEKTYASELELGVNPCGAQGVPCQLAMTCPPDTHYATCDTAEDAIRMVQTLPEPWFLYVAFNSVHRPAGDVPPGLPRASCGSYIAPTTPCNPGANPNIADRVRCMLAEADAQVGRLLCNVNDTNTTVMLWGDNGTEEESILPPYDPDHGKGSMYEDGVRVPFIIRSPYQAASTVGAVCEQLVSSTDTFATVGELCGVPASLMTAEDSISLVPYLQGLDAPLRRTVYSEGFLPNFVPDPTTGGPPGDYRTFRHNQTIRERRYKLVRRWERAHQAPYTISVSEMFFDLLGGGPPDPNTGAPTPDWFEQHDLLASGTPLSVRAQRVLGYLRGQLDAKFPPVVR